MEEITFNEIREGDELVVDYKGVAGRWLFAGCVLRVNVDERIGIGVARKGVRFKGMYAVITNGHAVEVKWLQSSTMRFWPMSWFKSTKIFRGKQEEVQAMIIALLL